MPATQSNHNNTTAKIMDMIYKDAWEDIRSFLPNVNVNVPYNKNGWTPFLYVVKEYFEPEYITLFLENGADINSQTSNGETALHIATRKRSGAEILTLLITNGANPNAQDNFGLTPLMYILRHPQASMRLGVVAALLEQGADTSIISNDGKTVFDYARENSGLLGIDINDLLKVSL